MRRYRKNNPEKVRANWNKWASTHKDQLNKQVRKWWALNKDEQIMKRQDRLDKKPSKVYYDFLKDNCCCALCAGRDALEFHHANSRGKAISKIAMDGVGLTLFLKELRKCVILCRECHLAITWPRKRWFKRFNGKQAPKFEAWPDSNWHPRPVDYDGKRLYEVVPWHFIGKKPPVGVGYG